MLLGETFIFKRLSLFQQRCQQPLIQRLRRNSHHLYFRVLAKRRKVVTNAETFVDCLSLNLFESVSLSNPF